MTSLDRITQSYSEDIQFLQNREVIAKQRKASIPRYNAIVRQFVDGTYTLDEFRNALKTLHQDTYWGAHKTFLKELNKLAKNHVPASPDVETKFRVILHNLNAQNVGQKIEQFYNLLTQEKKQLEAQEVSDSQIVFPGNSALIISLIAFWLDSTEDVYICYPSLRIGLNILLDANILPIPDSLEISKKLDIKSQTDYQTITDIVKILATDQPELKSGEYWAENFFLWVKDNQSDKSLRPRRGMQRSALPYVPLPSKASRVAIDCLTQLGFDKAAIVEDYKFSTNENKYIQLNALVFAHPLRRDLDDYASITMFRSVNGRKDSEIVIRLAETSALLHLIHHENGFALWTSGVQANGNKEMHAQPIQIKEFIPYNHLKDVMRDYIEDLKPQHIIEVKQGRATFKHTQFQDVNLTQLSSWAEDIRRKPLVKRFVQAINTLGYYLMYLSRDEIPLIAMQLLGLFIVADTGMLGEDIRLYRSFFSLEELVDKAHKQYSHFFDSDLLLNRYPDAVTQAYHILKNTQYAGFTLEMISDLHFSTYALRYCGLLDNYNMPLYLARRILDNIPLEYLRPEERVVADFTCGWGSFLIASQERLSEMSDSDEVPLQQCIYGNDHNKFFAQLARFGLLYTTAKDDWHVDNKDIFQQPDMQGIQANVIIGNALFVGDNNKDNEIADDKAKQFLEYAIQQLKPSGYLAFIMPRSFASSQYDTITRKKLLEECDLLELWELPREIFRGVVAESLIIFAQKKSQTHHDKPSFTCVRTRTLQPATIDNFRSSGTFTASALVPDQLSWNQTTWKSDSDQAIDCVFDYTTILSTSSWNRIEQRCNRLHEYTNRIFKVSEIKKAPKDFFSWQTSKILLQYHPYEQWGKRIRTVGIPVNHDTLDYSHFIDYIRIFLIPYYNMAKESLAKNSYLIDSTPTLWNLPLNMPKEVLAAILGWDVSNSWVIEHTKSSDVLTQVIRNIPIPRQFSEQDCQILINAVLRLEEEKQKMDALSLAALQAQDEIDTVLRKAYHLDDSTFQRLRQVTQWMDRSSITLDTQADLNKANWFMSGVVEKIDATNDQIHLWIDGFDDLQRVHIVPSMPGWMLRSHAAFLTKFPREFRRRRKIDPENIDWAYFHPQPYMYMSEEELLTGISQYFVRPPQ